MTSFIIGATQLWHKRHCGGLPETQYLLHYASPLIDIRVSLANCLQASVALCLLAPGIRQPVDAV